MIESSYKKILRSCTAFGVSQVVSIILNILKTKLVAVLLGPAGVGLIGLYQNVIQTAATIFGLGVATSGTRQVAKYYAEGGLKTVSRLGRELSWLVRVLSLIGAIIVWAEDDLISYIVFRDRVHASEISWLTLGIAVSILSTSQTSLLSGLRRIHELAQINILASVFVAIISILFIWVLSWEGLMIIVSIGPIVTYLIGVYHVNKLHLPNVKVHLKEMIKIWRELIALGFAFWLGGIFNLLQNLVVSTWILRELGADELGIYQAASTIGATYLAFMLSAMGTDYFSRISASNPAHINRLINEQTETALLLCGPVMLAMIGLSPWVVQILYTNKFFRAVDILHWQIIGDIFKIMSWPLGYTLLAVGAKIPYIALQLIAFINFTISVLIGLPFFGISVTGVAYLIMYIVHLFVMRRIVSNRIAFRWTHAVKFQAFATLAALFSTTVIARQSQFLGVSISITLAVIFGVIAYLRLVRVTMAGDC